MRLVNAVLALAMLGLAGCATTRKTPKEAMGNGRGVAWSLEARPAHFVVAVSPARQTLQWAGSTGLLLGASISAIANARHRKAMEDVLGNYNASQIFETRIEESLGGGDGSAWERIEPLDHSVPGEHPRDAFARHCRELNKTGRDWLLDLRTTHGLFGPEGTLVAAVEGVLFELPQGRQHWKTRMVVIPGPALADEPSGEPTQRGFKFSSRLSADEDAITRWTRDNGAPLRAAFEEAASGAAAALAQELGLAESAKGAYWLGRRALQTKDYEAAADYFEQAFRLQPDLVEAWAARAVAVARSGNVRGAVEMVAELLRQHPDYGPGHYNAAWWRAVELKEPQQARAHYERARALGLPASKEIEKHLEP